MEFFKDGKLWHWRDGDAQSVTGFARKTKAEADYEHHRTGGIPDPQKPPKSRTRPKAHPRLRGMF